MAAPFSQLFMIKIISGILESSLYQPIWKWPLDPMTSSFGMCPEFDPATTLIHTTISSWDYSECGYNKFFFIHKVVVMTIGATISKEFKTCPRQNK